MYLHKNKCYQYNIHCIKRLPCCLSSANLNGLFKHKVTNTLYDSLLVEGSICTDLRRLPQDNDKTVEDVESVSDVAEQSFSEDFHEHFDGEQAAEEQVAVFQYECVRSRLQSSSLSSPFITSKQLKNKNIHA